MTRCFILDVIDEGFQAGMKKKIKETQSLIRGTAILFSFQIKLLVIFVV